MGNWRTVQIIGSCSARDVPALKEEITNPLGSGKKFYCLSYAGGLAGLPMWAAEAINAVGNLAERDYSPDDVARTLEELSQIAPSLSVKVHCGDDWESESCVATVTLKGGKATIGPPEIGQLPEPPEGQMMANLFAQLELQRRR